MFLLSPAHTGGERARLLLSERAGFDLAVRLRREGAPLGEVFAFISGLYFRAKVAYASAFASPPPGIPAALVITAGSGLLPPETIVTVADLQVMSGVRVDASEDRFRVPLTRDAQALADAAGPSCAAVLLGSVATEKYVAPLEDIFKERLLFPADFVGRGDMSRGGLMLRAARSGEPLGYIPVTGAIRRGTRPSRLPRLPRF